MVRSTEGGSRSLVDYFMGGAPSRPSTPQDRWRPGSSGRSDVDFWRRHFWPVSAFGACVIVGVVGIAVALVATVIYATVDAGRPLEGEVIVEGPRTSPSLPPPVETARRDRNDPPDDGTLSRTEVGRLVGLQVYSVTTFDAEGVPRFGSAFVAGASGGEILLLTSLDLVRAAIDDPTLEITVFGGAQSAVATLFNWHEPSDLALLVVPGADATGLPLALEGTPTPGANAYVVTPGGAAAEGTLVAGGGEGVVLHDVAPDDRAVGAPLVNDQAEVIGVVSTAYRPSAGGDAGAQVAVPIARACERVLRCGDGTAAGART